MEPAYRRARAWGEHDDAICDYIAAHPSASRTDVAAALGVKPTTAASAIKRLQKEGRLRIKKAGGITREVVPVVDRPVATCTCGAPPFTGGPYAMRHGFASAALAAGMSISDLAEVMGHTKTKTTELYAHLLPGHLQKQRNVVCLAPPASPQPSQPDNVARLDVEVIRADRTAAAG